MMIGIGIGLARPFYGSGFDPLTLYAGAAKGLWVEQVDSTTRFQDTAGTIPATTAGDPEGRVNDKSGRVNNLLQATAAARPVYAVSPSSATFDGVDDGLGTAAFAAGTLTANMDCFIAVKRTVASQLVTCYDGVSGNLYFGLAQLAGAQVAHNQAGTPTYFVNGVAVPGGNATTRDQLNTAMPASQWLILEARNLDLSLWLSFGVAGYTGFALNGNAAGIILCEAQTDAKRAQIRTYLGNQVGLSL